MINKMKCNGIDLLADYVFLSKYSQRREDGRLEHWDETIDRIYEMHKVKLKQLGLLGEETVAMIEEAKRLEVDKKNLVFPAWASVRFSFGNEWNIEA